MNVAIIGCGYLGSEVASLLRRKGHTVTATTRHPEKLDDLSRVAQKSAIVKGNNEDELIPLIAENDLLIVTVAADGAEHYESAYLNTSKILRHLALEMDLPRNLIYTSSTSVYGDHNGQWVDETSPLLAKSEQEKILIEAEKEYLSLQELGWNVCLFRLAEIYGPGRELSTRVKQLEGRSLPGTGDHYTNMIHKIDAAHAIDYAHRHHLEGIFNLADDVHPTRKELYDEVAKKFELKFVQWDPTHLPLHTGNKRISTHKIKSEGFAFRYPLRAID
jgi:nucleoside-diphosphate-sugar epimerase